MIQLTRNNSCFFILFISLFFITNTTSSNTWLVGSASRTILPTVNGKTDYVVPLPPTDATSPGTFVKKFDVGQIAVGNGDFECHWVRDDLRVRVATIGPDPNGLTAVYVSVEVYMFFRNDLQQYYDQIEERVGTNDFKNLRFFVHAQHNHEGPDTSGISVRPINHKYYDYLINQMTEATIEALDPKIREPATLKYGSEVFYFGLGDLHDPLVQDARVRVIRAMPTNGDSSPVFTIVQWGMHPEVTLGYRPPVNPENCTALPLGRKCDTRGAYFTHDFPGHFSEQLCKNYNRGECLYFNGAIGVQIGNHGPVWEVGKDFPLGNGGTPPPGAIIVPVNFRRAFLIGQQLAEFTYNNITTTNEIEYTAFDYRSQEIWTRLTNFVFRVGMIPTTAILPFGDPTRPIRIGNTLREAFICPNFPKLPPSYDNCYSDNFTVFWDSVSKYPARRGQFMASQISYLGIGSWKWLAIPGEVCPELVTGLPQDFDTAPTDKYYRRPTVHAIGVNYTMPGSIFDMMNCDANDPCFVSGLTGDEIGYIFPISDWRVKCYFGSELCQALHDLGAMNYSDSMAGSQCKYIVDDQQGAMAKYLAEYNEEIWQYVNRTCFYGQSSGTSSGHYEETMSPSWDVAQNMMNGISDMLNTKLTGRFCKTQETCAGLVPSPARWPTSDDEVIEKEGLTLESLGLF